MAATRARFILTEKVRGGVRWGSNTHTAAQCSLMFTVLRLSRPVAEEQSGGLDPGDPWREGPGQLHHLPAASP